MDKRSRIYFKVKKGKKPKDKEWIINYLKTNYLKFRK